MTLTTVFTGRSERASTCESSPYYYGVPNCTIVASHEWQAFGGNNWSAVVVSGLHNAETVSPDLEICWCVRRMEMTKMLLVLALAVGSLGMLLMPVHAKVQGKESSALSFVKKTIASHSIVIFSKSYCPYCKRAKKVFKDLDETPFVVELDQREDGSRIQDALSELVKRRTVPQVFIDGEHIGGSDDTVEAFNTGRLKSLMRAKQSGDWQHDIS